jgi:hypothetical protein
MGALYRNSRLVWGGYPPTILRHINFIIMSIFIRVRKLLEGVFGTPAAEPVLHVCIGPAGVRWAGQSVEGWQVLPMASPADAGQTDLPTEWLEAVRPAPARILCVDTSHPSRLRPEHLPELEARASAAGFGRIELLLLTRDPGTRLRSLRSDLLMDPARGFVPYADQLAVVDDPLQALAWQEAVRGGHRTRLTIRNIDRSGERPSALLEGWLGLPSGTLSTVFPDAGRRELTAAEIVFLESAVRFARFPFPPIAEALTEVEPLDGCAPLPVEEAFRTALRERIGPALDAFNALAAPEARFVWDIPEDGVADSQFRYTPRQIEIIAEVYGRNIEAMRKEHAEVLDGFNAWLNA